MAAIRELVRRHRVAGYLVLAGGLSWAYWVPMAARGEVATPGGNVDHLPGLMGPLVAAVLVTAAADGRAGLRDFAARLVHWRVPARWYVVAVLPYLVFLAAIGRATLAGGELPTLARFGEYSGLPALALPLVLLIVLVVNGFGEEGGWRGFLTARLLARHGPLTTSLVVAAAWFAWHVPMFWVVETYREMGVAVIPMMGIGLVSGAIILTWIYIGTKSIWIVALWHLALNMGSATSAGRGIPGVVVWNAMLIWAILVVVGWMLASEPRSRPFLARLRDGSLIAILRSPIGRLFGGLAVITFRARRSGRTLMTPVECVAEPGRIVVLVSHPERKQWWRNVSANPDVTVELRGREVHGRATVHEGNDPAAAEDLAAYVARRPRSAATIGVAGEATNDRRGSPSAPLRTIAVRIDLVSSASA